MLIRLYNDGNGNFIWPKTEYVDKGERTTDGQVIRRKVPVVPERFQAIVYTQDGESGMRGCLLEGSAAYPDPDAKTLGQAILRAVEQLENGGGGTIDEHGCIDGLEKIEC